MTLDDEILACELAIDEAPAEVRANLRDKFIESRSLRVGCEAPAKAMGRWIERETGIPTIVTYAGPPAESWFVRPVGEL